VRNAAIDSPLAVVRSAVNQLKGLRVLDVGCGEGTLARQLAGEGAWVTGIDPNAQAIDKARTGTPDARFETGTAEALPFPDHAFDLVVMLNALHHVPVADMDKALSEAHRVLRHHGTLIVIEPLASGSFFEALRPIEDETEVRQQAQAALARAASQFSSHRTLAYVRRETFNTVDQFIARVVAVDSARQASVDANRDTIIAAVRSAAQVTGNGELAFDQPIKADILH
jgi:ubiquinone/menaquinone biosynthesis C-methylase UbiE